MAKLTKQFEDHRQKTLDILARERAILKAGEFHKLADLHKSKSEVFEHLQARFVGDPKDWEVVQHTLRRNQKLIEASLSGLHYAAQKLHEFGQIQDCLTTYNPKGKLQTVTTDTGNRLEKQA